MILSRIVPLFQEFKIPYCVVGGYAVALHGAIRGTIDLDIITELTENNLSRVEDALKSIGMKSSLPINARMVFTHRKEFIEKKNLIAWNFIDLDRKTDVLDILLTEDIRNYNVTIILSHWGEVPVIDLEGLIQLKSKTKRKQDEEDVKALLTLKNKGSNP